MINKRRGLSQQEALWLERFKKVWTEKKGPLKLTQGAVGLSCGWKGQSAFSQYIGGLVPLNIEAVLRLAKVLQVHPAEIMPEIIDLLPTESLSASNALTAREMEALSLTNLIMTLPDKQRNAIRRSAKTLVELDGSLNLKD